GLLAAWELLGITPETDKWGFKLQSPNAIPLILLTLVLYSSYKMTIEWAQCNPSRREHIAAKLDYRFAHMVAVIAIGISFFQYIYRTQIFDTLAHHETTYLIAMNLLVLGTGFFTVLTSRTAFKKIPWIVAIVATTGIVMVIDGVSKQNYKFL